MAIEISGHRARAVFDRYNIVSGRDHDDAMAKASAAERSEAAEAALGGYTTRIFVAQAIVAAVICGFVN